MKATVMYGARDVRVETVPDARLIETTDAVVRVTRAFQQDMRDALLGGMRSGAQAGRARANDCDLKICGQTTPLIMNRSRACRSTSLARSASFYLLTSITCPNVNAR